MHFNVKLDSGLYYVTVDGSPIRGVGYSEELAIMDFITKFSRP